MRKWKKKTTITHLHSGVEILQGILLKDANRAVILKNVLAFRRGMCVNLLFLTLSKETLPSVGFRCARCLKLFFFLLAKVKLAMIILLLHT